MTRVIVASAPRSGTHMLVRMLSRAGRLPWRVPTSPDLVHLIPGSWVIGMHATYPKAQGAADRVGAALCCLRREPLGHAASLERFGLTLGSREVAGIVESFPESLTLDYDALRLGSATELKRLRDITGIDCKPEPWSQRFDGGFDWSPTPTTNPVRF